MQYIENKERRFILWFDQLSNDDVAFVGGKNASLGEMYNTLSEEGIRVPNGFAVTAYAYRTFMKETKLIDIVREELRGLDTHDIKSLQRKGKRIRDAILKEQFPPELIVEIEQAYRDLSDAYDMKQVDVAVRSSATAEDLPGASFAGEHETFLNITGERAVVESIRKAMASLFTDRAISYRVDKGFDHLDVALSVGVQKMVRSDKACSGVMFTLDTESGFRDVVQISSSWGLGEMIVQGKVIPDEFIVFKPKLSEGYTPIIKKNLGLKRRKMVYQVSKTDPVKETAVSTKEQQSFTLIDSEIILLAKWGTRIEEYYSRRSGKRVPMDMEWAKDGVDGKLYIVQARPETVQSEKKGYVIEEYALKEKKEPIVSGISVGAKIATGRARVILDAKKLDEFKEGEILITEITDPDWEPIMKKAAAIITEKGGRTSHAAIVSRELGIPAVIGVSRVTKTIKTGDVLTVDCSSGVTGNVYRGELAWTKKTHDLSTIPETKTKVMLNMGTPEGAFMHSFLPHKGVGLAREEFIIASQIRIHPKALLDYKKITNKQVKREIDKLTVGFPDKREYYIEKLAEGIGMIAAAFYPHQTIVRFSDFKTNEYATLIGGREYEPEEENPMLGWRGASRYAHPDFTPAFEMECEAVKRVREKFGLTNLNVMVPFCRTPEEGHAVIMLMKKFGLVQSKNGLKVYVMCELPTNVVRADDFLDIFDGFSIGSNDLAQTTLGLDRDSAIVAGISNENDVAVKTLVSQAIKACKARGKYIGFCGQAPSDYPEFLRFLIKEKIESVSLNPDSIVPMMFEVAKEEKKEEG